MKMAAPLASKAGSAGTNSKPPFPELDFRSGARVEELNKLIQEFTKHDQREYDDQRALEIHTAKDFIFSMLGRAATARGGGDAGGTSALGSGLCGTAEPVPSAGAPGAAGSASPSGRYSSPPAQLPFSSGIFIRGEERLGRRAGRCWRITASPQGWRRGEPSPSLYCFYPNYQGCWKCRFI